MTKATNKTELKLLEQARALKNHLSTTAAAVVACRETSGDYGDMSQQSQQEWLFVSRNRADSTELDLIENALRRIHEGTYGTCSHCEQTIAHNRLRAVPWAQYCIQCQDGGGMTQAA
jgi:DnaK suppressor protein